MPGPTATIQINDTALKIGDTATVTLTFSEEVTGVSLTGFTNSGGVLANLTTADNFVYTATFTPTLNFQSSLNYIDFDMATARSIGTLELGSGIIDSGNYVIDTLRPTATGIAISDAMLKVGDTAEVTITFSEAVSGFTSADLDIANGTLLNVASSDGGVTWTGTLTPSAGISDTTN
ncbi:Ig-like domain-containing protein, partial [Phenylobacterium sp.]